jgi:hypothetical protein
MLAVLAVLVLACSAAAGPVLLHRAVQDWLPARPGLPADAATAPLARPVAAPGGSGGYRFLNVLGDGSGRPVRWDPCRPIHYVVREVGAPPGAAAALSSALREIESLTGLRFVADGPTTEVPRRDRSMMQVERYGRRWAPVLIAWTDPAEYPAMAGFAGLGGGDPLAGRAAGTDRYVSGVVLLNRDHLVAVAGWPGGGARLRAVILHELGHLVGLDHVDDPRELMYARPSVLNDDLADGDRRGLAALSGGPCHRDF